MKNKRPKIKNPQGIRFDRDVFDAINSLPDTSEHGFSYVVNKILREQCILKGLIETTPEDHITFLRQASRNSSTALYRATLSDDRVLAALTAANAGTTIAVDLLHELTHEDIDIP